MSPTYDAIIIGTGQAGPPLANRLTKAGMKIAIIERKRFGGTCVNTGCIPTKAMVASAYAAHMAARASEYGVEIDGRIHVDMRKVKARKDAISQTSSRGVEDWLTSMPGCMIYRGHARFGSAREVKVDEELLSAARIFIDVGGRAMVPAIPGLDHVDYLTNSSMMDVDFLPEHLLILGGSYIGLEFAQMYRRFGSKVTVIEAAPRLVPHEDEDISASIKEILEQEGIDIRVASKCTRLDKRAGAIVAQIEGAQGRMEVSASHLLVATGRRPNTDDLDLDRAGVHTNEHGFIAVDDQLRTNVAGIWALGECNGRGAFTHTAYNDFEIVSANLLDNEPRRLSDRIPTYGLFIDPPLGRVGMTEAQARATGRPVFVGRRPMTRVGRAVEKGETNGFMKVIVDAQTKQILGAAILGTGGDEAVHCLTDTMYAKAPYTTITHAVHIHPTLAELIPTMLEDLAPAAGG
ncbi:MAG: FAD-containing oxidoreductase [Methylobacteriaceae bacterium]|nr:FAD-containing oxidoreductase [Methylobacteriaceae bacterium]